MELYHWKTPDGNFGDDLNLWLWDDLLPGWRDWADDVTLVGVGTLLRAGVLPVGRKLVLGSGTGYGAPTDVGGADWDVRAVRGPRTAARLGLPADRAIADGAVMLPRLPRFAGIARGVDTVFVPHHHSDAGIDWPTICARAGIVYQTPRADADTVIRRLAGARAVIAESMHAAIIADAFGTPWRAVSITPEFNAFKWGDWAESLGMPAPEITALVPGLNRLRAVSRDIKRRIRRAPRSVQALGQTPGSGGTDGPRVRPPLPAAAAGFAAWRLGRLAGGRFALSERATLADAQDRFAAMLDAVRRDYGG